MGDLGSCREPLGRFVEESRFVLCLVSGRLVLTFSQPWFRGGGGKNLCPWKFFCTPHPPVVAYENKLSRSNCSILFGILFAQG